MADAVVSPLLGIIFDRLTSPLFDQFRLLSSVSNDLEKLSQTAATVRLVLHDAELKQINDPPTKAWLQKLKDAAYQADDIMDQCAIEQVRHSFSTFFDFKRARLRHKLGKQIKKIREKFDDIAAEKNKFSFAERVLQDNAANEFKQYRETCSLLSEPKIYGRVEDKDKIVNFLMRGANDGNDLSVYAIVGMGGIGKTTLAKMVYHDTRLNEFFNTKIWICVSDDFGVKRVMKMIIASLSENTCQLEDLDPIQNQLKALLNGKKFLLVLDDVWNDNRDKWDQLRSVLAYGAKGSSVIVTTRQPSVASIMGRNALHHLAVLSEDQCWDLFKGRTFFEEEECHKDLEVIGKQIVKKCGGIPLAAKALGGMLNDVRDVNMWISVRDNAIWKLPQDNESGILPSLKLSYNHLPSNLRQCFVYCSVFAKDSEIEKDKLIQLWMANDFVQSIGTMELEDIGNQIFNQLVLRSFLQDVEEDIDGIVHCKMHDLMHDLACSIAADECCSLGGDDRVSNIPNIIRHLSISQPYLIMLQNNLETLSSSHAFLRTLIFWTKDLPAFSIDIPIVFKKFDRLRALDLNYISASNLPTSIGKMKNLRYLNLSYSNLKRLPNSICGLINLQTLILRNCKSLQMLPKCTKNLVNLRHLDLSGCSGLTYLPDGMRQLVCLRTLGLFIVGEGSSIKELKGLNHLSGELNIHGLENVRDATEAKEANLATKKNLSSLSLIWDCKKDRVLETKKEERILECLQPHHQSLTYLSIRVYNGSIFPSWIKLLVNIVHIELIHCSKCEDLPPLGHLPLLKSLCIGRMECLKFINNEFYGNNTSEGGFFFPSLKILRFWEMYNLEKWEDVLELDGRQTLLFPCLERLHLTRCPKLVLLPSVIQSRLKDLWVGECEKFIVRPFFRLTSLALRGTMTSFKEGSLQNLNALESLSIVDSPTLMSIPEEEIQNLTALKSLYIHGCESLKSLPPMGRMIIQQGIKRSSLVELSIGDCKSLTSLFQALQYLSSLETLNVGTCEQLEFSSRDFKHLTAIQTICLHYLPKLTSLPELQHLSTLQELSFWGCKNLKVLPQGLQNLTSLRKLQIMNCHPDLHARCEKDIGDYWPYISSFQRF